MITDSHCHLGSHKFSPEEIPQIIANARDLGVTRMITLATCEEDLERNLRLANTHPGVHACIGIHPCDVHEAPDDFESLLTPHFSNPNVAALGETGLDYFHPAPDGWTDEDYHARQRDFLRRHFQLGKDHGLNLVIHTRDRSGSASFDDALAIYREFHQDVRAVFHCFPGPLEQAQQVFALEGLISFTGIVTFKNAAQVADTASHCPSGSFMLETDAPYLSPVPHRGQRCEPGFTRFTAECIANLRKITLEDLAAETENTVCCFFRI
ncbi:MAG: TatD family hydrolase [Verrucomicrobiaceae bacterium]